MASSSSEVPYNHSSENVLFGQNVVEKITDTCLGQDGKRYYQVKWRDSWEPEERLMSACEAALQAFWKEYYANVEQEIRKQVVSASKTVSSPATIKPIISTTVPGTTVTNVIENFPEQSSTVAYYAVQGNEAIGTIEEDASAQAQSEVHVTVQPILTDSQPQQQPITKIEAKTIADAGDQVEILTQIINNVTGGSGTTGKWTEEKPAPSGRKPFSSVTTDTLNTKNVSGPDQNARFHCDICLRTFVSKRNVQRHMLSHTGEKPWMCEFCFKRFRQKPHLEQHVNIHRGIKNAVCSICGKAFNHRSNLVTHMATHSNVRPHTCEVCGESFKLKHTLQKHAMVHTKQDPEKRHQCKICKRSFRDRSYLLEHEMIHKKEKPWQCDICLKSFAFKRRYQIHMEIHQNNAEPGDEGLFLCHLCPKKFKGKIYLQKHLDKHESKKIRTKKKKRKRPVAGTDLTSDEQLLLLGGTEEESAQLDDDDDGEEEFEDGSVKQEDISLMDADSSLTLNVDDDAPEPGEEVKIVGSDGQEISVQIAGTDTENMMVASMLPMTTLNVEDATYVALAQLTQAAIESAPLDSAGNVILMRYEDIQQSMQDVAPAGQQEQVDASLQDAHIISTQQHLTAAEQVSLDTILKVAAEHQLRQEQQQDPTTMSLSTSAIVASDGGVAPESAVLNV